MKPIKLLTHLSRVLTCLLIHRLIMVLSDNPSPSRVSHRHRLLKYRLAIVTLLSTEHLTSISIYSRITYHNHHQPHYKPSHLSTPQHFFLTSFTMSLNMTPQQLHDSNDKAAMYGLIAWLVGFLVGSIIFGFILIWCCKWIANNVFGCHFSPIHGKSHVSHRSRCGLHANDIVEVLKILRKLTPLALYRRAREHIKQKRERQTRNKHDLEKGQSLRSSEPSSFTLAYSSDRDRHQYESAYKPSSSFSRNQTTIERPKPVLAQHSEAWWREQGSISDDMATVIRLMQQDNYARRASNQ